MNVLRNKVQLIGRLGKDPESFVFDDGKMEVNFPIATNEVFKDPNGEKQNARNGMTLCAGAH